MRVCHQNITKCQPFHSTNVSQIIIHKAVDVEIETLLTFSSASAEYQLLVSHSQLVGHDYFAWASACSGKLC